jgi:hypothetical protein
MNEMNPKDLCQHVNSVKTERPDYKDSNRVKWNASRDIQGELAPGQKSFLICESCFWFASLVYGIEGNNKISHFTIGLLR